MLGSNQPSNTPELSNRLSNTFIFQPIIIYIAPPLIGREVLAADDHPAVTMSVSTIHMITKLA